jgi:hypothetical protein
MAQRKRAGLITRRSLDRNEVLLVIFFVVFIFSSVHHFSKTIHDCENISIFMVFLCGVYLMGMSPAPASIESTLPASH